MKRIITKQAMNKISNSRDKGPSVDDQPNFVNRDRNQQGNVVYLNDGPDSDEDVKKKFKKKKKKYKKEEMPKASI